MAMAEQYESARAAFMSLDAAPKVSKRVVLKWCHAIARAHGTKVYGDVDLALAALFRQRKELSIFERRVRAVQVNNSNKVIFFSDVYQAMPNEIEAFEVRCRRAGIPVAHFEKRYPDVCFSDGFVCPKRAGILNTGYCQMYRGKLSGVVVG